ncbi:MAG: tRNA dihydrouridine synthase DusB [Chlorobi bacterium]|nr:tRNA dihydrouridine synthase DusB [Chlorobiota bacterium]
MQIGNIKIPEYPLLLAPMEDITDRSFRKICKSFGADLLYTEFVASEALIRNIDKTLKKLVIDNDERPAGIQIYGHRIDAMVEAAKIAEEAGPDLIDINYGCPVKKIATRGAGAGMLRDIPKMIEMTKAIVNAVKLPVTVKTRLGWDNDSIIIDKIAEQLQDTGIKALTIHGRTRSQLYKGKADWTLIGKIKQNPNIRIPVIGNGDITDGISAKNAFEKYKPDGIMIGRASIGRPWIFKEIKHYLKTGEILPEPDINQKVDIAKQHFKKSIKYKDGNRGIFEMRRHFALYFKGLKNFKETRLKLLTSTDINEIYDILDQIKLKYGNSHSTENAKQ